MTPLLRYLDEKRRILATDYPSNCLTIARDIARLLVEEGKRPFIAHLYKVEQRGENMFHYPLMPKKYRGRVTWTTHYVCCCEESVYDPMFETEICINQYSEIAFGEDFPMEIFVSEAEIDAYLNRSFESRYGAGRIRNGLYPSRQGDEA